MAHKVVLSPRARQDVKEAADYIRAQSSPERARLWKNGLLDAISSLAEMPQRCAVAPEADDLDVELAQLVYHSHRVIFRVQNTPARVDVLRVYHSARAPLKIEDLP